MDEFGKYIYILLGIGYFLYSLFKAPEKKKDSSKPFQPETDVDVARKKIEELLGKRFEETRQVPVPSVKPAVDPRSREVFVNEASYAESTVSELKTLEQSRREKNKHPRKNRTIIQEPEQATEMEFEIEGFDMRKAVIYSAIINRPYA